MVDKEARDLLLLDQDDDGCESVTDYMLMKLVGGDNPTLLTTDSTATEVPESYIIYKTAGMIMSRPVRGESADSARMRMAQADRFLGLGERAKSIFPMLKNARFVS
jgi:hypothetical protein